jgi:gluconokinase
MVEQSFGSETVLDKPAVALREPSRLPRGLWRYRADRRRALIGGALSNGGNLYQWLERTVQLPEPEERERLLAESLSREHGLVVLPFLAGERAPNWRDNARGVIAGLSLSTRPIHLLQASLEAVGYRFALIDRLLAEVVQPAPQLIATGAALERSPAWAQILADVFGRPVTLSGVAEGSSRGVALLALEAIGAIDRIEDVEVPLGRVFEPDLARHRRHREAMARQQVLYDRLLTEG